MVEGRRCLQPIPPRARNYQQSQRRLSRTFIPLQLIVGQRHRTNSSNHELPMRLFSSDLYRNFGIGFLVGALLVAGANAEVWSGAVAAPAQAAQLAQEPAPAADFVIAPEGSH